jgi:hypothetical protein
MKITQAMNQCTVQQAIFEDGTRLNIFINHTLTLSMPWVTNRRGLAVAILA